jgi:predicted nucleotide-binding protein
VQLAKKNNRIENNNIFFAVTREGIARAIYKDLAYMVLLEVIIICIM